MAAHLPSNKHNGVQIPQTTNKGSMNVYTYLIPINTNFMFVYTTWTSTLYKFIRLLCFLFFSRTFFRQAAVKQDETRDRSLRARRPTGVGQDIALQRRAGVRVANVGGELAEARSERSLRCDCEYLPPPAPVRGCDSRALRRVSGESSALRDAEGLSLLAPSPSNFEGQHRQATPPGSLKLRVSYPMLALGRGSQGEAGLVVGARSAAPVTPKRADERQINRYIYLHASKGRESMRDDLEFKSRRKTLVATRAPASRQMRAAARSRGQARRTSTPAVGQAARWSPVEGATAAAGSGFKWQWEAQAPEEHAAEGVILQRELLACWQRRESEAAAWPSLGEQQSLRRSVKVSKQRLKGPLIQAGASCLLPSPCRVAEMARLTDVTMASPSVRAVHGGASNPARRRAASAWAAARVEGVAEAPRGSAKPISIRASTRGCRSPMTGMASAQEAQ